MKLTRKQIKEGLEAVPMDVILLGSTQGKEKALSPKQTEFARQLALGETKAGAYRKAISPKAKPTTASREGHRLASKPKVITTAEAFRLAIEAGKLATPAHLRALTIHKLTEHALDETFPPAQRVKALELLGKITEVALFTERREVVQVHDSQEIRERLLNSLRLAMQANSIDADSSQVSELMAEIRGESAGLGGQDQLEADPAAADNSQLVDPPPATPPNSQLAGPPPLLSNPHIGFGENSAVSQDTTDAQNVTITPVIVRNPNEINDLLGQSSLTSTDVTAVTDANVSIGGVGAKVSGGFENAWAEKPPVNDLVPSGNWK